MATKHTCLTKREIEVLQRIAANATNQEIAADLFISPETVKNHVTHVLQKLASRSRLQAAVKGIRLGLVDFPECP
jgi:DNA-binding CsgD family transcriptional regulator